MARNSEKEKVVVLTTRVSESLQDRLEAQRKQREYEDLAPVTRLALAKGLDVLESEAS